jgi:hypothetical protein
MGVLRIFIVTIYCYIVFFWLKENKKIIKIISKQLEKKNNGF